VIWPQVWPDLASRRAPPPAQTPLITAVKTSTPTGPEHPHRPRAPPPAQSTPTDPDAYLSHHSRQNEHPAGVSRGLRAEPQRRHTGAEPGVFTYSRCMHRVVAATVLAVAVLLGFSSCAETNLSTSDVYKVGCPAVDAAAGGSSAVSKVTVAGLKKVSESGRLDPEPQRWVEAVITLFDSEDPRNAPDEVQKLVIEGCAKNGYPLQNLHVG
jgi:hypothetical protein